MILNTGLSKTGTKSLAKALQILGYKTKHLPDKENLFKNKEGYEAFCDIPCLAYLEKLLTIYPDAKLICTTRPYKPWIISCMKHFNETSNLYYQELRGLVYKSVSPTWKHFEQAYKRYNEYDYSLLSNPVLFLPVEHENKWSMLCDFLNKPKPNISIPYPHVE
jgi:hypothetical protein